MSAVDHTLNERVAHLEAELEAQEALWIARAARLDERWHNQEKNLTTATEQLEERLTLLNELRNDVLTRSEHNVLQRSIEERLMTLEKIGTTYLTHGEYEQRHIDLERRQGQTETAVVALPNREEYTERYQEFERRLVMVETNLMPRETISNRFIDLETWRANLAGRMIVFAGGGALVIGVISALIGYGVTKVLGI